MKHLERFLLIIKKIIVMVYSLLIIQKYSRFMKNQEVIKKETEKLLIMEL